LINDSGFNCVIRYVHVEHQIITKNYCSLFVLQDGSYDVSAMEVSIQAWTNSQHTLIQGNSNSTLNVRNVRVHTEDTAVAGFISIIGTFKKAVAAGLQKRQSSDLVDEYTGYLNTVWNVYSLDGLPPFINDGYSLPPANDSYRGRMFYKRSSDGSDVLYVCVKDAAGNHAWIDVAEDSAGNGVPAHSLTHITGGTDVIPDADAGGSSGLMSSADKSKLDGVAPNANNYVHPSTHPATMIVEDSTHRFVTDSERVAWNSAVAAAATYAELVSALPAATSANRGRIVLLLGASNAMDRTYICKKLADNTYDWRQLD
jgi:hypothetical protein